MTMPNRKEFSHSGGIPSTPGMRLLIVRDHATAVFGSEQLAEAWLGQSEFAVLDGQCVVATACQTPEGFEQAMLELSRIRRDRSEPRHAAGNPWDESWIDPDITQPRPAPRS